MQRSAGVELWVPVVLAAGWGAAGCGRVSYLTEDASVRADASMDAPRPIDALDVSRDALSPDSFSAVDAFSATDAFSPDAFSATDASSSGTCNHIEASGAIATYPGHPAIGTGPFTMEAWVRTPSTLATRVAIVLGAREATTPYSGYLFGLYDGQLFVQLSDTPNIRCGPVLADDVWHHVAFVRDAANNLLCYVDFVMYTPDITSSTRDLPRVTSLVIGEDSVTTGSPLDGGLWMARVFSTRRDLV